jgi:hypothetical protein
MDGEGVLEFRDYELEVIELPADRVQQDQVWAGTGLQVRVFAESSASTQPQVRP